jgi:hypothetical protein
MIQSKKSTQHNTQNTNTLPPTPQENKTKKRIIQTMKDLEAEAPVEEAAPDYPINDADSDCSGENHNDHSEHEHEPTEEAKLEFAKEENNAVWYLRFFVFLLLACVALAVCLSVYYVGTASEKEDFEQDFEDLGDKLVESFGLTIRQRFGIVENFALDLTSFVNNDANNSWPFVTLPDYERRAGNTARLADLTTLHMIVRVETEQRTAWDAYSNLNQGWFAEGFAIQQGIPVEDVEAPPIAPTIIMPTPEGEIVPDPGPGPFFPIWQTFPVIPVPLSNYNTLKVTPKPMTAVLESGKPVVRETVVIAGEDDPSYQLYEMFLETYESYGTKYEFDPASSLFFPGKFIHTLFPRLVGKGRKEILSLTVFQSFQSSIAWVIVRIEKL